MQRCTKDINWLVGEQTKTNYREEQFTSNLNETKKKNTKTVAKQKQLDKQIALQARINFICRVLEIS